MIKLILNKDTDNMGDMLGISPDRMDKIRDILADFGAKSSLEAKKNNKKKITGKEIGNVIVELVHAVSPETPEEMAYIFYSIPRFMEMYVSIIEEGVDGALHTLLGSGGNLSELYNILSNNTL
jgi:hypothetical protein